MTDLARWQARVTPAVEAPRPHVNSELAAVPSFHSSTPAFMLPPQWTLSWAARLSFYRQSHPVIAGQAATAAVADQVWRVTRIITNPVSSTPTGVRFNTWDGVAAGPHIDPAPLRPHFPDDMVDALSVDLTAKRTWRWTAPAVPLPGPDTAVWTEASAQEWPTMVTPQALAANIVIGSANPSSAAWPSVWNGSIYWVEMRAGLAPGQGRVLWRWDAAEYNAAALALLDWTDPRGRTWRNSKVQYPAQSIRFDLGLPAPRRATVSRVQEHIFTGTGPPSTLPNQAIGDRYLDTDTGDIWLLTADYCLHTPTGTGDARTDTLPGLVTGDWDVRVACLPVPIPDEAENRWLPTSGQRFLMAQKLNVNDDGWGIVNGGSGQRMMLRNRNVWLSTVGFGPAATSTGLGGRVQLDVEGFARASPHERNAAGEWLLDRQAPTIQAVSVPAPTFTAPVRVPGGDMNNLLSSAGDYYAAELRNAAGAVVLSVDFTRLRPGDTSLTDDQGRTWTLTGDAAVKEDNVRWERVPT